MRTRHLRPAAAKHPTTGEEVWFNQADLWHPSSLPERIRTALLAMLAEDDLYHNVRYGDGAAIDPADLQVVGATFRRHASVFPWVAGDVLIVDNMLVGHGRNSFVGPRRILAAMS
jgi:alpha-ketoglutarate-dependent taurine dioxygenase